MSLADESLLATDATFQSRVRAAMLETALAVAFESPTTANHQNRLGYAVVCMNNPDGQKLFLAGTVATDASVISDATVVGTVVLILSNLAAQAALVTDAHIRTAVNGSWSVLF